MAAEMWPLFLGLKSIVGLCIWVGLRLKNAFFEEFFDKIT